MSKRYFYVLFVTTFFFLNCLNNQNDHEDFISRFQSQQNNFNKLMVDLRSNNLLQKRNSLKIFRPGDFNKSIKERLDKLGVTEVLFYLHYCDSLKVTSLEFNLTTNWSRQFPVHLTQAPCNSNETTKDNYFKNKNTNEGWGLGDNWCLWFEHISTKGAAVDYDKKFDTTKYSE